VSVADMSAHPFTPQDIQARFAGLLPDLMGIEFVETSPDRVLARMRVRPDLCTAGGILHGGSVMAFADTLGAVGTVINMPAGARTTTVESSTKFLAGAPVNTVVTGESTAFHKGRTTMVWQTLIRNESGRLCAVVTQTQLVMAPSA
jgi:1,4-dihydroxy-2-naphthoyl-CoA hydrolase